MVNILLGGQTTSAPRLRATPGQPEGALLFISVQVSSLGTPQMNGSAASYFVRIFAQSGRE
jgi:hypothetical protein